MVRRLERTRVLPLATLDASVARQVGETLVEAGLPCIEIAFRHAGAAEAISSSAARVEGLLVGAGTVLTPEQARAAADAGAAFAVAPGLNEEVVDRCRGAWAAVLPRRRHANRDRPRAPTWLATLKAFPISRSADRAFLRAVAATYPDVRFIPTGGVDASTLRRYLACRTCSRAAAAGLPTSGRAGAGVRRARAARTAKPWRWRRERARAATAPTPADGISSRSAR